MFDVAAGCANTRADVFAPFPTRFIRGATNCRSAQMHEFESTFLHDAHFVRRLERFENDRQLLAAHPGFHIKNGARKIESDSARSDSITPTDELGKALQVPVTWYWPGKRSR